MRGTRKKRSIDKWLIIVIAIIGIGYAFLVTDLSASGSISVDSNSWSIYWDNVQVDNLSKTGDVSDITGEPELPIPEIVNNDHNSARVSFDVQLNRPGDIYIFTVEVHNGGTLDAMIDDIVWKVNGSPNIPPDLVCYVTYNDYVPLEVKEILTVGGVETYKVVVEFNPDIEEDDLSEYSHIYSLSLEVTYVQADSSAQPVRTGSVRNEKYFTDGMLYVGDTIPDDATLFDTSTDAMNVSEQPFFVKSVVVRNTAIDFSIGFVYNGVEHLYSMDSGHFDYEQISNDFKNIFGSSSCVEYYDSEDGISCTCGKYVNGNINLTAHVNSNSFIVGGNNRICMLGRDSEKYPRFIGAYCDEDFFGIS